MAILDTEFQLSDKSSIQEIAAIFARVALDGAIDNQKQNSGAVSYDALNSWGFSEIIDFYVGRKQLEIAASFGDTIKEPITSSYYDQVIIDTLDADIIDNVLALATEKLAYYAKSL